MKIRSLLIMLSLSAIAVACRTAKDEVIRRKNNCYEEHLTRLKTAKVYEVIHSTFADTFAIMKAARPRPSLLEEKIDEAIFFSGDSTNCLLIVLERNDDENIGFGSARIYNGYLHGNDWKFDKSMWFTFGHDYFKKYPENSFDNVSKVARYAVLTQGNVQLSGCDIDEYFWFVHLRN